GSRGGTDGADAAAAPRLASTTTVGVNSPKAFFREDGLDGGWFDFNAEHHRQEGEERRGEKGCRPDADLGGGRQDRTSPTASETSTRRSASSCRSARRSEFRSPAESGTSLQKQGLNDPAP
ncbi:MAG: hypothetical protein MJ249_12885, partial [Kiritimatiellae bacterium]|nr:hypothetical protein [Kiritimatiellia bacterium]